MEPVPPPAPHDAGGRQGEGGSRRPFVTTRPLPDLGLWERASRRQMPLAFSIDLTARCTNNCRHCYINLPPGDREAQQREPRLEDILDVAAQAVEMGALWCLLSGGEPLLRPDFNDIYLSLKRLELLVSVFTNACLVTEEHATLFARFPPRDLEVTIYGATAGTYERATRTPGSYAAFRRGLDRLRAAGVPVRLKAMALRSNLAEFPALCEMGQAWTGNAFRWDPSLHLRYDGNPARNADIRAERLSPREIVTLEAQDAGRLRALDELCRATATEPSAAPEAPAAGYPLFQCSAGLDSFVVTADGRLGLCASLRHPDTLVDLEAALHGGLEPAWTDLAGRVRGMRSTEASARECALCPSRLWCANCPAHAYLETGALEARVECFCQTARLRR